MNIANETYRKGEDKNMAPAEHQTGVQLSRPALLALVWISTLMASALPEIIWQELIAPPSNWLLWTKVILLGTLIGLSLAWQAMRPLRDYFIMLLLLVLLMTPVVLSWVETALQGLVVPPFSERMLAMQVRGFGVAFIMIALLLLMKYNRSDFFLTKGKLDTPVELGTNPGLKWNHLLWLSSVCIVLGALGYLVSAGQPASNIVGQVLPLFPVVILFAASNAFSEEMRYRALLIAPVCPAVGKQQAILLTSLVFGLAHYLTGIPGGLVGVALTGLLGWLLGKSMLETRGSFWAWFIHFWGDVYIFLLVATGSITPGG
jgi:membrane protease YdiL (CAAX protease family)